MKQLGLLAAFLAAVPASAQPPGFADPRIQSVDYHADQVVRVEAAVGYQVTIELAPDEQIQTVAVGDTSAWQVSANKAGDRLFVKPVQARGATNMIVVTTARSYNFELVPGSGLAAYTLRFRYLPEFPSDPPRSGSVAGHYRLTGDRRLWPVGIHDDGDKTFIDWPADAALPAVYVIDALGREQLANGNFRGGIYVIDGVERTLLFRIDQHIARASRYAVKKTKA